MARKGSKRASQAAPDQSGAAAASGGADAGAAPGGASESDEKLDGEAEDHVEGDAVESGSAESAANEVSVISGGERLGYASVPRLEVGSGGVGVGAAFGELSGPATSEGEAALQQSSEAAEQIVAGTAGGGRSPAIELIAATDVAVFIPTAAEVEGSGRVQSDGPGDRFEKVGWSEPGNAFPRYGRLLNNSASALADPSSGVFVEAGGSVRVYLDSEEHAQVVVTSILATAEQLGIHAEKLAFVPA